MQSTADFFADHFQFDRFGSLFYGCALKPHKHETAYLIIAIPVSTHSTELAGYPSLHNVIFVQKFSILFLVKQVLKKRSEEINIKS
jgi:hypothetical protein